MVTKLQTIKQKSGHGTINSKIRQMETKTQQLQEKDYLTEGIN